MGTGGRLINGRAVLSRFTVTFIGGPRSSINARLISISNAHTHCEMSLFPCKSREREESYHFRALFQFAPRASVRDCDINFFFLLQVCAKSITRANAVIGVILPNRIIYNGICARNMFLKFALENERSKGSRNKRSP